MSKDFFKHSDYVTHLDNSEDKDILTRKLFDVNMRLFQTSWQYKKLVLDACEYIRWCCSTKKEGYKKPHGFSGANAGIPFNIIAVNGKKDDGEPHTQILINPKIIRYHGKRVLSTSNCGSLTVDIPIEIERYEFIDVEFYLLSGEFVTVKNVDRVNHGFTIQHEVDHNMGILILDRVINNQRGT